MIVSASYKTDIPAFYGAWFMARVAAGFCRVTNPYGGQAYDVSLAPGAVDGIVFWTKNLAPFRDHLTELRRRGFTFTMQYGITGLPRAFERSVVEADSAIADMHDLAAAFGPRVAVWRYDPVLLSSLTPPEWHIENFSRLARALAGASDEVVISFAQIYRKTRRNLMAAARAHDFTWRDPAPEEKLALAARLAEIAADRGMELSLCTQPELRPPGTRAARCIDAGRLADVAGRPIAAKEKGNRPGCLCHASRDIGAYDTCPHGCVYCYAVENRPLARRRHGAHDAEDEFLFPPPGAR